MWRSRGNRQWAWYPRRCPRLLVERDGKPPFGKDTGHVAARSPACGRPPGGGCGGLRPLRYGRRFPASWPRRVFGSGHGGTGHGIRFGPLAVCALRGCRGTSGVDLLVPLRDRCPVAAACSDRVDPGTALRGIRGAFEPEALGDDPAGPLRAVRTRPWAGRVGPAVRRACAICRACAVRRACTVLRAWSGLERAAAGRSTGPPRAERPGTRRRHACHGA